jgi:8-oxo-dGTP diphosphatase
MRTLQTIKPEDVDASLIVQDYSTYTPRLAVRAVVFDDIKVALILVQKYGYYMLPGGGINEGEDETDALNRELYEELGSEIKVTGEVGSITIYNDRWCSKQTDFCYTATLILNSTVSSPTDFEAEEGHKVVWFDTIADAIEHMYKAIPKNRDGKLVRARDLLFLETVVELKAKETSQ